MIRVLLYLNDRYCHVFPDEIPHHVAFHQGFTVCQSTHFGISRHYKGLTTRTLVTCVGLIAVSVTFTGPLYFFDCYK